MVMKMRSVFILLLIVAYAGPYLSQGYVYTSRYRAVLNAWGTFACAMSNAKILLVCFVGYILLISDVPYFSAANIYEVVRSKRWTIMPVRVIALLKVTLLYFAVLFVLFCILGGCTDFNPNVWDRIHYSYAHGQYIEDLYMDVPGNVMQTTRRFQPSRSICACCCSSLPAWACSCCLRPCCCPQKKCCS